MDNFSDIEMQIFLKNFHNPLFLGKELDFEDNESWDFDQLSKIRVGVDRPEFTADEIFNQ